ncbi:hypothetical protein ACP275_14G019200 [Erythranthe tilingii]
MGKQRMEKNLPEEIMEEIMYKLPVKSLLRFKCVSKSWNSIISDKDFIKHHLKKSITDDDDLSDMTNHKLIARFKHDQPPTFFRHVSCSLHRQPIIKSGFNENMVFSIMGSCNGLLLVTAGVNLPYLWNPTTKKYKKIDLPLGFYEEEVQLGHDDQVNIFSRPRRYDYAYGLGYDESNDDYKIVCNKVSPWNRNPNLSQMNHTLMYSSKANSWKKIENSPKSLCFPGKFVAGRLHWLCRMDGFDIICLNLTEEKYEIVGAPQSFTNNAEFKVVKLEELGGYLSLTIMSGGADVDVWVMTEYGKRESWSKVWTLSNFVSVPADRANGRPMRLLWRKNGDIAVAFGSEIVVYNGKNVVSRSPLDILVAKLRCYVYVESLVWPFASGDI